MAALDFLNLDGVPIIWSLIAMAVLALLSWFMCRFFLRLRIREIVNKSIIDNIKELYRPFYCWINRIYTC